VWIAKLREVVRRSTAPLETLSFAEGRLFADVDDPIGSPRVIFAAHPT